MAIHNKVLEGMKELGDAWVEGKITKAKLKVRTDAYAAEDKAKKARRKLKRRTKILQPLIDRKNK